MTARIHIELAPGTRIRVTGGTWRGRHGVVLEDHGSHAMVVVNQLPGCPVVQPLVHKDHLEVRS